MHEAECMWQDVVWRLGMDLKLWHVERPRTKSSDTLNMPMIINLAPWDYFIHCCNYFGFKPNQYIIRDQVEEGIKGNVR